MSKVILQGYIKVSPEDLENVKEHLNSHIQLTRDETGCIEFKVSQRESDLFIFDVYEEFEDSSAFYAHQDRVKNSVWSDLTKNIERNYEVVGLDDTQAPVES